MGTDREHRLADRRPRSGVELPDCLGQPHLHHVRRQYDRGRNDPQAVEPVSIPLVWWPDDWGGPRAAIRSAALGALQHRLHDRRHPVGADAAHRGASAPSTKRTASRRKPLSRTANGCMSTSGMSVCSPLTWMERLSGLPRWMPPKCGMAGVRPPHRSSMVIACISSTTTWSSRSSLPMTRPPG